jgi:hypothetical protein
MKKRKIDFSTRNLQAEILSQHTPWVGTLTQAHKKIITDQKCIESDIINHVHTVLARQFSDIKGFQNTAFAPQFNIVEQEWISNKKITDITGKCAQINHTGQDHSVTSVQTDTDETYILDSLFEKLTVSQEIKQSQIYSHGKKRLLVKMPEIHKQTHSIDCGLYAIANAVEYCLTDTLVACTSSLIKNT